MLQCPLWVWGYRQQQIIKKDQNKIKFSVDLKTLRLRALAHPHHAQNLNC